MKNILDKLMRNEKGQTLPIVLALLVVGSLLIAPLLSYMTTSIKAAQLSEERVVLRYAADAGVDVALWMMKNEEVSLDAYDYETEFIYTFPESINGSEVTVTMQQVWPLSGLESDEYGTTPCTHLMITGGVINEETGQFKVQISYDGAHDELPIDRVGVWLPLGYDYVTGSSSGITTDDPTNILDWHGGKALEWDFEPTDFLDLPTPLPPEPPPRSFVPANEYPAMRDLTFNVSPVGGLAEGSYTWVRTTNVSCYLSWDTSYSLYKISSSVTNADSSKSLTVESYSYVSKGSLSEADSLFRGGYRAIGNTLMKDLIKDKDGGNRRDELLDESSAEVANIPGDAEVAYAYLYWSAWREERECIDWRGWGPWKWCVQWGDGEADKEVSFEVNGQGEQDISASKWWLVDNDYPGYAYSCFRDVTKLVKLNSPTGNGIYTVGGVDGKTNDLWSYAGWSLIIFYSSPTEQAQQFHLYDDFLYSDEHTTHTFTITGFESPGEAQAGLTCFVGEGDELYAGDCLQFNDYYLSDQINPQDNVWNGKSSGLDGQLIDGVDIDTFDVSSPIINPGDTSAEVKLTTEDDSWNLVYLVLSFRSDTPGGLAPNSVGIITYEYK